MKIALIGYSGSGKSTLAALLGKRYGLRVLHLDTVHWLPGWQERPAEEKQAILEAFMAENEGWVIDGNYSKLLFDRRMEEADRIIFFNFNRFTCFARAYRRYRTYKGKSRESMTEGCPEKIDREFARWLLIDGRKKKRRAIFERVLEAYPQKTVILRNQRQLSRYMKECEHEG